MCCALPVIVGRPQRGKPYRRPQWCQRVPVTDVYASHMLSCSWSGHRELTDRHPCFRRPVHCSDTHQSPHPVTPFTPSCHPFHSTSSVAFFSQSPSPQSLSPITFPSHSHQSPSPVTFTNHPTQSLSPITLHSHSHQSLACYPLQSPFQSPSSITFSHLQSPSVTSAVPFILCLAPSSAALLSSADNGDTPVVPEVRGIGALPMTYSFLFLSYGLLLKPKSVSVKARLQHKST